MLHRYLGIAVGVLLFIGFPGIVMMYLGFPRPLGAERLLTPLNINWQACCHVADDALSEGQPMARAEIEMLRGVPVLHLLRPPMPEQTINLADGSGVSALSSRCGAGNARTRRKNARFRSLQYRDWP
jgi:hypothetical protein